MNERTPSLSEIPVGKQIDAFVSTLSEGLEADIIQKLRFDAIEAVTSGRMTIDEVIADYAQKRAEATESIEDFEVTADSSGSVTRKDKIQ